MSVFRANHLQFIFIPILHHARRVFHTFGPTIFLPEKHAALTPSRPVNIDPLSRPYSVTQIFRFQEQTPSRGHCAKPETSLDRMISSHQRRTASLKSSRLTDPEGMVEDPETQDPDGPFPRSERKSPAASFGGRRIGCVVLPLELQRSILRLISGV